MKRIGIIGGIGPESTIAYYRLLIQKFRERLSTNHYPEILLHSIDMTKMLSYVFENDLDGLATFLQGRIQVLEASHIDYVVLASNTPHLVFDQVAEKVDVKMISIVEATCQYIKKTGVKKVGLLGTKSTMSRGFYQKAGEKYDLEIVAPNEDEQNYVNEKYMGELVFNQIIPETKKRLIEIIDDLRKQAQIEGIILGGTELPLILQQDDFEGFKVFDTTQIHVEAILDAMLG